MGEMLSMSPTILWDIVLEGHCPSAAGTHSCVPLEPQSAPSVAVPAASNHSSPPVSAGVPAGRRKVGTHQRTVISPAHTPVRSSRRIISREEHSGQGDVDRQRSAAERGQG